VLGVRAGSKLTEWTAMSLEYFRGPLFKDGAQDTHTLEQWSSIWGTRKYLAGYVKLKKKNLLDAGDLDIRILVFRAAFFSHVILLCQNKFTNFYDITIKYVILDIISLIYFGFRL
jgi:hypothetical protein